MRQAISSLLAKSPHVEAVEAQNFLKGFIDQECVGEYPADVVHELRACYHLADPY